MTFPLEPNGTTTIRDTMEKHEPRAVTEPAKTVPVRTEVDVAVIGAGPTGIMAALAAAE